MVTERTATGRAAWGLGGLTLIVLGGVLIWITQAGAAGLSEDLGLVTALTVRTVTFVFLGGGAWCLARAGKQRA